VSCARRGALALGRGPLFKRVVDLLERFDRAPPAALPVLTYHRVDDRGAEPDLDPALISATPAAFEAQVSWLAANRTPLSLPELLEIRRGHARLPPRPVVVTFDDAYRDFAGNAWPVLRGHGVPAILFVPTGYPDRTDASFWWDRLHSAFQRTSRRDALVTPVGLLSLGTAEARASAFERLRAWVGASPHEDAMVIVDGIVRALGGSATGSAVLGWTALRTLAREGVALAPHSRSHARLDRVPDERLRDEIAGSRDDLLRETGTCPPAFAFPGGGHDARTLRILAEERFELGFTTLRGSNSIARGDWLKLHRNNVGVRTSLPLLRVQLNAWPSRAMTAVRT
jgi:peptidoglycan/xylan/chitin deacetylase (PgdA/CDA1 family)